MGTVRLPATGSKLQGHGRLWSNEMPPWTNCAGQVWCQQGAGSGVCETDGGERTPSGGQEGRKEVKNSSRADGVRRSSGRAIRRNAAPEG